MLQPYFAMHDPHIYPLDAVALDLTEEGFSPTQTEQSVSTRFQEGYAANAAPRRPVRFSSGVRGCCPCKCVSCCNCACAAADICSRAIRHNSWLSSHDMRTVKLIASGTSCMVGRTAARKSRKTSSTGRCKAAAACWACSMVFFGKVSVMVVMGFSTRSDATSNSMCILAEGCNSHIDDGLFTCVHSRQ